jgi:hypothetical protein
MKPQVSPLLAGIVTAVVMTAAIEFGRRSGCAPTPTAPRRSRIGCSSFSRLRVVTSAARCGFPLTSSSTPDLQIVGAQERAKAFAELVIVDECDANGVGHATGDTCGGSLQTPDRVIEECACACDHRVVA